MSAGGQQINQQSQESELNLSGSLNLSSGQISALSLSGPLSSAIGTLPVEDLIREVDVRAGAESSGSVRSLKDVKISKLVEALARTPVQADFQEQQAGTLQRLGSLTLSVDDWWQQNVHDILSELHPGGVAPGQGPLAPGPSLAPGQPAASSSDSAGARQSHMQGTPIAEMTLGQALDRLDSSLIGQDNKRARNLPVEDFCQQLLSLTKQDSSTLVSLAPCDSLDAYQVQAANAAMRGGLSDPSAFGVLHNSHGSSDLQDSGGLLAHAATFPGAVLPVSGYSAPRTMSDASAAGGVQLLPGGFLPRLGSTSSTASASPLTIPLHSLALGPDQPMAAPPQSVSHPASLSSMGNPQSPDMGSSSSHPMPSIILTEATVRGRDFREQLRAHLEQMQREGDGGGEGEDPDVEYADDILDDDEVPPRRSVKAVVASASAKLGSIGVRPAGRQRGRRSSAPAGSVGDVGGSPKGGDGLLQPHGWVNSAEMARKRSLSEMSNASSEMDSDLDDGASSTGSRSRLKHEQASPSGSRRSSFSSAQPGSPRGEHRGQGAPKSSGSGGERATAGSRRRASASQSAEAEEMADPNSKEAKQALRKLKNRESALRSRLRKEQHVRDLEEQVATLVTENEELRRAVERMQLQKRRDDLALRKTVELLARADATIDSFRRAAAAAQIVSTPPEHSLVAEASAMLADVAATPAAALARPSSGHGRGGQYRVSPTASQRPPVVSVGQPQTGVTLEPPNIKRSSSWNS